MKRKMAAILAAEVDGYARRSTDGPEQSLVDLQAVKRMIEDLVRRHDGRLFHAAAGSFMAEFASTVEACRCAAACLGQVEAEFQGPQHDGGSRSGALRLGLSVGDIVENDGVLLGDGVNLAARLAGIAKPGSICVSRAVYEQVRNKVRLQATDIGAQRLKNLPDPVHAFLFTRADESAGLGEGPNRMPAPRDGGTPPDRASAEPRAWHGLAAVAMAAAAIVVIAGTYFVPTKSTVGTALTPAAVDKAVPESSDATRVRAVASPGSDIAPVDNTPSNAASAVSRVRKPMWCSEILERVQSGVASADDRAALQKDCL